MGLRLGLRLGLARVLLLAEEGELVEHVLEGVRVRVRV